MVAAYTSGDLNTLDRIIHEEIEHPGMKEIFLDHRNAAWMPRLREWLQLGNSFIAVGAGHLAGEGGLISLLMADGYKVTPVLRTGEATEAE